MRGPGEAFVSQTHRCHGGPTVGTENQHNPFDGRQGGPWVTDTDSISIISVVHAFPALSRTDLLCREAGGGCPRLSQAGTSTQTEALSWDAALDAQASLHGSASGPIASEGRPSTRSIKCLF